MITKMLKDHTTVFRAGFTNISLHLLGRELKWGEATKMKISVPKLEAVGCRENAVEGYSIGFRQFPIVQKH